MKTLLTTLAVVFLYLTPASAQQARICVEAEAMADAAAIVFAPNLQERFVGESAQAWLDIFNEIPPETNFSATEIIFQKIPGNALMVMLSDGTDVCERFYIDEQSFVQILNEMSRRMS